MVLRSGMVVTTTVRNSSWMRLALGLLQACDVLLTRHTLMAEPYLREIGTHITRKPLLGTVAASQLADYYCGNVKDMCISD
jgi:hypothetical protein